MPSSKELRRTLANHLMQYEEAITPFESFLEGWDVFLSFGPAGWFLQLFPNRKTICENMRKMSEKWERDPASAKYLEGNLVGAEFVKISVHCPETDGERLTRERQALRDKYNATDPGARRAFVEVMCQQVPEHSQMLLDYHTSRIMSPLKLEAIPVA